LHDNSIGCWYGTPLGQREKGTGIKMNIQWSFRNIVFIALTALMAQRLYKWTKEEFIVHHVDNDDKSTT